MSAPAPSPALAEFAEAYRQPLDAARAFKAGGGKVVGYMSPHAPVEIIEALGMMALRLDGGGVTQTPRADAFMETRFDPTVRGVCERLLAGELDFLDALILPRSPDSVQRLYYYLCEQARTGSARLPRLLFYDVLHSPAPSSADYSFTSLQRVATQLSDLAETALNEEALARAVADSNRRRSLLLRCLEGRRRRPATLRGAEALHILSAAARLTSAQFTAMAERYLAHAPAAHDHGAPLRLILSGNAPDTDVLHLALERLDAEVVGDFHDRGELAIGGEINAAGGLRAVSDHYHRGVHSARTFTDPTRLVDFARAQNADCVLFFFYDEEEVLTWDYPTQRDALSVASIPSLCLSGQSYAIDARRIAEEVAPLIESLMQGRRP